MHLKDWTSTKNNADLSKLFMLTTLMNAKEELQQFNDVVLISKKKCISLANSETSTEALDTTTFSESNSTKKINTDNSSENTYINKQLNICDLKVRMPNIKVFSGKK